MRTWKSVAVMHHHSGEVKRVKFSNNGKYLATTSGDKTAKVFDSTSLHCVWILAGHSESVFDVGWGPSDAYIATAAHDATWSVWDLGHTKGASGDKK